MLTENEVVIAMCSWLKRNGYNVKPPKLDTSQGHDIEGECNGVQIYVECKGGASKKTRVPFSIDYQWRLVAGAFFNQVKLKEMHQSAEVGIALPDGGRFPELMKDLRQFLERSRIRVFWVSDAAEVTEWQCAQQAIPADRGERRRSR